MEAVLDVYKRPFDSDYPVVCMDETTKQCTREVRAPIKASPGQTQRYDGEYERNGVAHLMLFYNPLENWRNKRIADNHASWLFNRRVSDVSRTQQGRMQGRPKGIGYCFTSP